MPEFAGTFWALLPPVIAIALALLTKEVYVSLLIGILSGALLYNQRQGRIAVRKGLCHRFAFQDAAGVQHRRDAQQDECRDGNDQITHPSVAGRLVLCWSVVVRGGLLCFLHSAEIKVAGNHKDHHHNGQQGVEIKGDGLHKQREAVEAAALRKGGTDRRGPAGNRGDDAHRCRGGVDEVGELGTGNVLTVGYRTHHGADGQAVEIVVHKDQRAQPGGCKRGAAAGAD